VPVPGGVPRFDAEGPSSGRIQNFLLGGRNYGSADEQAARQLEAICPAVPQIVAVDRMFISRAVGYAAGQGVSQFIDLGCGLPPGPQVHEMAQSMLPGAATAYVDLDGLALGELDVVIGGADRGRVALVEADLRRPGAVLSDPGLLKVIDPGRPVCVLACLVLHFQPARQARRIVAGYARRAAPGSFVAVAVPRFASPQELAGVQEAYAPAVPREFTPAEVAGLLAGLEVVPPGVGPAAWLQPGWQDVPRTPPDGAHVIAGIGRKP
jgi:hypothetical protein